MNMWPKLNGCEKPSKYKSKINNLSFIHHDIALPSDQDPRLGLEHFILLFIFGRETNQKRLLERNEKWRITADAMDRAIRRINTPLLCPKMNEFLKEGPLLLFS